MIVPGSLVTGDDIPACAEPVSRGEDNKYLGWSLRPGEVALVIHIITVDKPAELTTQQRQWAYCSTPSGLGWFLLAALDSATVLSNMV